MIVNVYHVIFKTLTVGSNKVTRLCVVTSADSMETARRNAEKRIKGLGFKDATFVRIVEATMFKGIKHEAGTI